MSKVSAAVSAHMKGLMSNHGYNPKRAVASALASVARDKKKAGIPKEEPFHGEQFGQEKYEGEDAVTKYHNRVPSYTQGTRHEPLAKMDTDPQDYVRGPAEQQEMAASYPNEVANPMQQAKHQAFADLLRMKAMKTMNPESYAVGHTTDVLPKAPEEMLELDDHAMKVIAEKKRKRVFKESL